MVKLKSAIFKKHKNTPKKHKNTPKRALKNTKTHPNFEKSIKPQKAKSAYLSHLLKNEILKKMKKHKNTPKLTIIVNKIIKNSWEPHKQAVLRNDKKAKNDIFQPKLTEKVKNDVKGYQNKPKKNKNEKPQKHTQGKILLRSWNKIRKDQEH